MRIADNAPVWGHAERPDGTFVRVLFRNADRVAYREFHASGCRMGCLVAGLVRIRPNSILIYPTRPLRQWECLDCGSDVLRLP